MSQQEKLIPFVEGQDWYTPRISAMGGKFEFLRNVTGRKQRLVTTQGLEAFETIAGIGRVVSFGLLFDSVTNGNIFYVFGEDGYAKYNALTESFVAYSANYPTGSDPVQSISWDNSLFISRPGMFLSQLSGTELDVMDTSWFDNSGNVGGRYVINANNHLMVGNVQAGSTQAFTRVQWSDLNKPSVWRVEESNEADFYDLGAEAGEITGLTRQQGYTLIYSTNNITRCTYVGFPVVFRFDTLKDNMGNVYHYSVVSVKESDYFIDRDGIYKLTGQAVTNIGEPIWEYFRENLLNDFLGASVYGSKDETNKEIFWTYQTDTGFEQIVYNYIENRWSVRDAFDAIAYLFTPSKMRLFKVIDDYNVDPDDIIDSQSGLIDSGSDQFITLTPTNYVGGAAGAVFNRLPTDREDLDGSPLAGKAQTYELFFTSADISKELARVVVLMSRVGDPTIALRIGYRDNQFEDKRWTDYIYVQRNNSFSGDGVFFPPKKLSGKFLTFELTWQNTNEAYIDELFGLNVNFDEPQRYEHR